MAPSLIEQHIHASLLRSKASAAAGDLAAAQAIAADSRQRARESGLAELEIEALYRQAECHMAEFSLHAVLERLTEAERLLSPEMHPDTHARVLSVLATAQSLVGNYEDALTGAHRARRAVAKVIDPRLRAGMTMNIGSSYCELGAFDEAEQLYEESKRASDANGYQALLFDLAINATSLAVRRAHYECQFNATPVPREQVAAALRDCESLMASADSAQPSASSWMHAYFVTAWAQALLGLYESALKNAAEARALAERLNNSLLAAHCQMVVAEVRLGIGDLPGAQAAADLALPTIERLANPHWMASLHRLRASIHEAEGRFAEALTEERQFVRALQADMRRRSTHLAHAFATRQALAQTETALTTLADESKRLAAERSQLETLSYEDTLTGLGNRRFLDVFLREQLDRSERDGTAVAVAVVDVDRFKSINDNFSHAVGDKVLARIATAMRANVRDTDIATRLAGDEFVIVMPGADIRTAEMLRQRLREAVAGQDWAALAPGLSNVSVSIGIAQARCGDLPESLVEAADKEMYVDKRSRQPRGLDSQARH